MTVGTIPTTSSDPFEAAMNATESPTSRVYFGQVVLTDVWYCVLEKGIGKRPWNEGQDPIDKRCTAIKISVEVARQDGSTYTVDQDAIDFSKEWQITRKSLLAIGAHLKTLRGQYVQVKRVPTGDTFKSNKTGETLDKQGLQFVAVYPDRAACEAAAAAFYHRDSAPAAAPTAPAPTVATDPNLPEREMLAKQFLPLLWQASGSQAQAFYGMIAGNPLLAKHFAPDSPEVMAFTL